MASSSTPDQDSLVTTFNALPRSRTLQSTSHPNVWHISHRHIPLQPPSSVLFILHPLSGYHHVAGPIPPSADSASSEVKATVWAMVLLKAFNTGLGVEQPEAIGRPWSWACNDAEMAGALGETLRGMGVKVPEEVGLPSVEESAEADKQWEAFLGDFLRMMGQ